AICPTVRVVERFQTRGGRETAAGDPTAAGEDGGAAGDEVAARAHRFTVLVPAETTPAQIELVRRVVALAQPAHTAFAVKHYWALLRVGEVRLGLDTQLGEGGRFVPFRRDETALAEGYLAAAYPETTPDRFVLRA